MSKQRSFSNRSRRLRVLFVMMPSGGWHTTRLAYLADRPSTHPLKLRTDTIWVLEPELCNAPREPEILCRQSRRFDWGTRTTAAQAPIHRLAQGSASQTSPPSSDTACQTSTRGSSHAYLIYAINHVAVALQFTPAPPALYPPHTASSIPHRGHPQWRAASNQATTRRVTA